MENHVYSNYVKVLCEGIYISPIQSRTTLVIYHFSDIGKAIKLNVPFQYLEYYLYVALVTNPVF